MPKDIILKIDVDKFLSDAPEKWAYRFQEILSELNEQASPQSCDNGEVWEIDQDYVFNGNTYQEDYTLEQHQVKNNPKDKNIIGFLSVVMENNYPYRVVNQIPMLIDYE